MGVTTDESKRWESMRGMLDDIDAKNQRRKTGNKMKVGHTDGSNKIT